MLEVWTACNGYRGEDKLNITVKSGDKTFAPEWDMVMQHKQRKISDEEYIKKYVTLMRESLKEHPQKWKNLINRERIVLTCYCEEGKFCHRVLLAKMLEKSGAKYMGEVPSNMYHKI